MVRLRRLTPADLPQIHAWYQSPELWDHFVDEFRPHEAAEAIAYMRRWLTPTRTEARLAIDLAETSLLLGVASLTSIDPDAGEAELHVFLGDAHERGRGYGRAATAALLAYAFDERSLRRVRLQVLRTNAPALRTYAALGFERDPPGADPDVIDMTITDSAFRIGQAAMGAR